MNTLLAPYRMAIGIFQQSLFVRYVFSGGIAAVIDIVVLYILVVYFGVYYLAAATFAMTISFIARFILQKFITFQNDDRTHEKRQFAYYSILYIASLAATNALLYVFVDIFGFPLVISQIASILLIACACYFIYQLFIFTEER